MRSLKTERLLKKASLKNKPKSLAPKPAKTKTKKKKEKNNNLANSVTENNNSNNEVKALEQPLSFFLNQFQSANDIQLSSLELDSIKESCILELSESLNQDAKTLGKYMKAAFGSSWKEVLCEGHLLEGKIYPGSPAVLIISTSALRSIELLRGLRSLTKECHAVKLFSKHMKVEEQDSSLDNLAVELSNLQLHLVSLLKNRVNFGSGTPSRINKLIDIEALGLSRLEVIVLDMQTDVKGYSLFTLPQVRDEFWDLYKNYFHQRLLQGNLRICLYGSVPNSNEFKGKRRKIRDE